MTLSRCYLSLASGLSESTVRTLEHEYGWPRKGDYSERTADALKQARILHGHGWGWPELIAQAKILDAPQEPEQPKEEAWHVLVDQQAACISQLAAALGENENAYWTAEAVARRRQCLQLARECAAFRSRFRQRGEASDHR